MGKENREPETETVIIDTVTQETGDPQEASMTDENDIVGLQDKEDTTGSSDIKGGGEPVDDVRRKVEALNARPKTKGRKDPLSFKELRREHDQMLIIRSVLIMVIAVLMLIPMPTQLLALKFMIFIFTAYASIYNERMISEEESIRRDKHSHIAHIWSYIAFIVVMVLFFIVAIKMSMTISTLQNALSDANARLVASGLMSSVVR